MSKIKSKISEIYRKLPPMGKYLLFSIIVTVADASLSWFLSMRMGVKLEIANSIGIITGSVLHYMMSSEEVFDTDFGLPGAAVFFGTFIFGLFFANFIISVSFKIAIEIFSKDFAFLVAKGFSVVIPFFALYFLRKFLYGLLKRRKNK